MVAGRVLEKPPPPGRRFKLAVPVLIEGRAAKYLGRKRRPIQAKIGADAWIRAQAQVMFDKEAINRVHACGRTAPPPHY
jgi:hypothetical protein